MLSAVNTVFYDIETNAKKNSRKKFHFLKKLNPGTLTSWLQVVQWCALIRDALIRDKSLFSEKITGD